MGMEMFKNLIPNKQEDYKWNYHGDIVDIVEFSDTSKDRPKSAEFQKSHPELYDYLTRVEGAKKFNVSIFHIDGGGDVSSKFVEDKLSKYKKEDLASEENQSRILREVFTELQQKLLDGVKSDFENMAHQIKEDPEGDLAKIEYFTSYSLLANKKDIAKSLGIEIFKMDDDEIKKWEIFNYKQRNRVRDSISKFIKIKYLAQEPQIALFSRESILKLYKEEYSGEERCADWLARFPEKVVSLEDKREAGPEIVEFENMIADFESRHSLAELNSIIDLNRDDASSHPIHEPARLALLPIVALMNTLKNETNITEEKHKELKSQYKILSRAVGMINKGKVDHDR